MKKLLMMFFALLTVMVGNAAGRKINIMDLPPFERAVIIIKKFETLHRPKDYPYYQKYNVIQSNDIKSFYTHGYTLDFGCYSCDNKSALTLSKHIEKYCCPVKKDKIIYSLQI